MICHEMEGPLNDLADGTIPADDRSKVEQHVAACAACRVALEDLKRLVAGLSALPRSSQPSRDLLPGALAAIRREAEVAPRGRAGARSHPLWTTPHLALAAMIVIAVSFLVTAILLRDRSATAIAPAAGVPPPIAAASTGAADVAAAEADLVRATATLLEALRQHRQDLPAETLAGIESNLRIVDQAIGEARSALARDPLNARLGHLVTATYQTKLDLIRGASRLPSPV